MTYDFIQNQYDNALPQEGEEREIIICPNCGKEPEMYIFRDKKTKEVLCCDMCAERVDIDDI